MSDKIEALVNAATQAYNAVYQYALSSRYSIYKTIWSSPAGKKRLATRFAAMLPPHKTYVEPFAGSAAVLFTKSPAEVEVINDFDPEIAQAFRLVKRISKEQISQIKKKSWTGDAATYKRLLKSKPNDDVNRLYRFLYLSRFSFRYKRNSGFSPSEQNVLSGTPEKIALFAPRLKKVRIENRDYEEVIKQYDSPQTVFFLDPPYSGYDVGVGESKFDENRFFDVLKSIKGKFLLTYGVRGNLPSLLKKSGFHIRRIRTKTVRGKDGATTLTQLLVSNYILKKSLDDNEQDGLHLEGESPVDFQ